MKSNADLKRWTFKIYFNYYKKFDVTLTSTGHAINFHNQTLLKYSFSLGLQLQRFFYPYRNHFLYLITPSLTGSRAISEEARLWIVEVQSARCLAKTSSVQFGVTPIWIGCKVIQNNPESNLYSGLFFFQMFEKRIHNLTGAYIYKLEG